MTIANSVPSALEKKDMFSIITHFNIIKYNHGRRNWCEKIVIDFNKPKVRLHVKELHLSVKCGKIDGAQRTHNSQSLLPI